MQTNLKKLVSGVRYLHGEFQLRCEACKASSQGPSYWPLTLEFWEPEKGMNRCRACWATYHRRRMAAERARDPELQRRRRRAYYEQARTALLLKKKLRYAEHRDQILARRRELYHQRKNSDGAA